MFKKLIIIIPVLGIIIAALVQGTSGRFAVGEPGQRVVLTTDAGVINDRSFNENAFLGVREFLQDKYNLDGKTNNYVDAAENTKIGLLNNYKLGVWKKADALVMPGFAHIEALSDPASNFLKDKTVVLVDAELTDPERNKNVISVIFNAELSGLQAGFDASYWATRKDEQGNLQGDINKDNEIVIGAFAGASAKNSVNNFMFGMFLGMELFNLTIGTDENVKVGFANSTIGNTIEGINPNGANDSNFFSGTFALGDAVRSGILTRLVDTKHADIIFPIAGPQIQEVISYEAKRYNGLDGYKPYIIGIDVDQTITYPTAAKEGRFLNSAIKNLHTAVYQSLSHSKTLRQANNPDGSLNENYNTDTWEGHNAENARNWSESTIGGDNLIKEHALILYANESEADQPFGNTPIDLVLKKIMEFYDQAGNDPKDHLKGAFIQEVANQVKDEVKTNLLVQKNLLTAKKTKGEQ